MSRRPEVVRVADAYVSAYADAVNVDSPSKPVLDSDPAYATHVNDAVVVAEAPEVCARVPEVVAAPLATRDAADVVRADPEASSVAPAVSAAEPRVSTLPETLIVEVDDVSDAPVASADDDSP